MSTPQLTEQYGHMFRVSVARWSLKLRTSAWAGVAVKPSRAALVPPAVALQERPA